MIKSKKYAYNKGNKRHKRRWMNGATTMDCC